MNGHNCPRVLGLIPAKGGSRRLEPAPALGINHRHSGGTLQRRSRNEDHIGQGKLAARADPGG